MSNEQKDNWSYLAVGFFAGVGVTCLVILLIVILGGIK